MPVLILGIFPGWGGEPKFGGGENPPSAQCHFISIGKPIKKSLRARMERFPPPLNLRPPPNQPYPILGEQMCA